jgi:hypothetical protein
MTCFDLAVFILVLLPELVTYAMLTYSLTHSMVQDII